MIEAAHNARIRKAYQDAHAERARAFASVFGWLFKAPFAPLSQPVLTEPSRWA